MININEELKKLYLSTQKQLYDSIGKNINNPRVYGQTIGRRFGKFWEDIIKLLVKQTFPKQATARVMFTDFVEAYTDEFIARNKIKEECVDSLRKLSLEFFQKSGTEKQDLCDVVFTDKNNSRLALETKWRILWNDAKTVRQTVLSGEQLSLLGYKPVILLRRPREESRESILSRCESRGKWKVIAGSEALRFIMKETKYDLEKWIKKNVNFWEALKPFHSQLKSYRYTSKDFEF